MEDRSVILGQGQYEGHSGAGIPRLRFSFSGGPDRLQVWRAPHDLMPRQAATDVLWPVAKDDWQVDLEVPDVRARVTARS